MTALVSDRLPIDLGLAPITAAEFRGFQTVIHQAAGIWLSEGKEALLTSRIGKRIRNLRLDTFGAYLEAVRADADGKERARLVEAICTHETQFFREPGQFDHLERSLIPAWVSAARAGERPNRVRVWSAGCSSGEEPFSLAMSLLAHLPLEGSWEVEILATDISDPILASARTGIWSISRAAAIPAAYLRRFMQRGRGTQAGRFAAGSELRRVIRFAQLNLRDGPYHLEPRFDAIFCRNVLIYFDPDGRQRAHADLVDRLAPGGELFLGHAETLQGGLAHVVRVCPTVYRRVTT